MKYLVTGSSGFLGSYFLKKLIQEKKNFIGIDIKRNPYFDVKKFIKVDIVNLKELTKIFSKHKVDIVIHFAAIPGFDDCQKNPKKAFDTNISGTNNLVYLSRKFNIKKFLFISSFSTKNYLSNINTYGFTKFVGEQLILNKRKNYSMNACILRLSNVFGKYSSHKKSVVHQFVKNSISNKSLIIHDSGRQSRDLIYAGDVINKIYEIIKENKFKKKIYEVCKGKNISINKLSNLIDKITKKHNNIKKIKAPVGYDTKVKNKKKKFNQTYISYLNKRLLSVLNWYREQN